MSQCDSNFSVSKKEERWAQNDGVYVRFTQSELRCAAMSVIQGENHQLLCCLHLLVEATLWGIEEECVYVEKANSIREAKEQVLLMNPQCANTEWMYQFQIFEEQFKECESHSTWERAITLVVQRKYDEAADYFAIALLGMIPYLPIEMVFDTKRWIEYYSKLLHIASTEEFLQAWMEISSERHYSRLDILRKLGALSASEIVSRNEKIENNFFTRIIKEYGKNIGGFSKRILENPGRLMIVPHPSLLGYTFPSPIHTSTSEQSNLSKRMSCRLHLATLQIQEAELSPTHRFRQLSIPTPKSAGTVSPFESPAFMKHDAKKRNYSVGKSICGNNIHISGSADLMNDLTRTKIDSPESCQLDTHSCRSLVSPHLDQQERRSEQRLSSICSFEFPNISSEVKNQEKEEVKLSKTISKKQNDDFHNFIEVDDLILKPMSPEARAIPPQGQHKKPQFRRFTEIQHPNTDSSVDGMNVLPSCSSLILSTTPPLTPRSSKEIFLKSPPLSPRFSREIFPKTPPLTPKSLTPLIPIPPTKSPVRSPVRPISQKNFGNHIRKQFLEDPRTPGAASTIAKAVLPSRFLAKRRSSGSIFERH